MPSKIQRELALLLTGKDVSWSKTVTKADKTTARLHQAGAKAGRNMARNLERGVVVGAAAATTAIGFAINQAMDWESAVAGVAKTVDGDISGITKGIVDMSNRIPVASTQLAGIAEAGGALGVAKDDILDFTEVVALLGVTTDLTSDAAATSLGHLRTTLKLTGDDFTELGDTLVYLGNNGASTESQILSMSENIAGAADVMDASKEQVLGWGAALANTGEEAEAGGSSIQRFWLQSFKSVNKGGKELKLMAKIAGQTTAQFKEAFGRDATGTLAKFIAKLGELSKAEQLATLEALGFTDIRITRALLKLLANTDNLTDSLKDAEDASGEMGKEAAKRFETTAAQMAILKNNVDNAAASIGTKLLPVVNELAKEGVSWLQAHEGDIERFGDDLAAGIRDAVTWAKSLDWELIGSSLRTAGMGAKAVVDAFAGMPPWIQQAVLTGWGLNKLTGGAVVDFGKIAIDQFAGRGSSPANPVFVSGVGGLGGPGGTGGGGRSLAGGLLGGTVILGIGVAIGEAVVDYFGGKLTPKEQATGEGRPVADFGPVTIQMGASDAARFRSQLTDRGHEAGGRPRGPTQGPRSSQDNDPDKRQWRNDRLEAAADRTNAKIDKLRLGIGDDLGNHGDTTKEGLAKTAATTRAAGITSGIAARLAGEKAAAASRKAGDVARAGGVAAAVAIRNKDLSVSLRNTVNVRASLSTRDAAAAITAHSIATGVAAKNR